MVIRIPPDQSSGSDLVGPDGTFWVFLTAAMSRAMCLDRLAENFPQPQEFPEVLQYYSCSKFPQVYSVSSLWAGVSWGQDLVVGVLGELWDAGMPFLRGCHQLAPASALGLLDHRIPGSFRLEKISKTEPNL